MKHENYKIIGYAKVLPALHASDENESTVT